MSPLLHSSLQNTVYLIIPVHNRKAITLECLERLKELNSLDTFSVVVIDDGSTDGTSDAIKADYPNVILLSGDGNLWWTGAITLGMEYARSHDCEFIIWLNDDCLVSLNTLEGLIDTATKRPRSIVGSIGYEIHSASQVSFGGKRKTCFGYEMLNPQETGIYTCDLLSGNLVCIPVSVIEEIGYPDVACCPHYGGDALFLIKARKAGYSLILDTRYPTVNISTSQSSKTNPKEWLTGNISSKGLFAQLFNPHSLMSVQVLWILLTEDYMSWGFVLFLSRTSKTIFTLCVISILRVLLPIQDRKKISKFKRILLRK